MGSRVQENLAKFLENWNERTKFILMPKREKRKMVESMYHFFFYGMQFPSTFWRVLVKSLFHSLLLGDRYQGRPLDTLLEPWAACSVCTTLPFQSQNASAWAPGALGYGIMNTSAWGLVFVLRTIQLCLLWWNLAYGPDRWCETWLLRFTAPSLLHNSVIANCFLLAAVCSGAHCAPNLLEMVKGTPAHDPAIT